MTNMNASDRSIRSRVDWRAFYRREAQGYESLRYGGRYGSLFNELHLAALAGFIPSSPPVRVLDVAAGTGHVTELVASLGHQVTCVDLTEEMLTAARNRIIKKEMFADFVLGDAFTLPFPDDTFQIVVSTRFLHLWPPAQQYELVREMTRVLKPGGTLIVDFDNGWHRLILHLPIRIYQRWSGRGRIVGEYYNRERQACDMIRDAGCRIKAVRGIGGYPLVLAQGVSRKGALALGRLIGSRRPLRLFSEQFMIAGEKP